MNGAPVRATRRLRDGLSFGESPRWHEGRLWYSDFFRHAVYSVREDGSDERHEHDVAGQPSGLGWTRDGDLLCVSMTDQRLLNLSTGTVHADISPHCGFWANDMVVGPRGVAYVGSFGFDLDTRLAEQGVAGLAEIPTAALIALDEHGGVLATVPSMVFPNGAVVTPDGTTLIVAETLAARLTAFTLDVDGAPGHRRVWADVPGAAPDGICLDAEGALWLADAANRRCLRVREGGEVTDTVSTGQRAFACALGGEDRRTLFVLTAPTSSRFRLADQRLGTLEAVRVDVAGVGFP